MRQIVVIAAAAAAMLLAACGGGSGSGSAQQSPSGQQAAAQSVYDPQAVPTGPVGGEIKYGRELIDHTRAHLGKYVTANMDCQACHINGGTVTRGGTFVGIAAQFPQWNKRSKRVISLQDRIAECFLYSMNGHPPPYYSRAMEAMVAYITYISRGVKLGTKPNPAVRIAQFKPPSKPDPQRGAKLYAQKCSMCHGAGGAGSAAFPPLWGPKSFNNGAGMHRVAMMAGFVRYNMPKNAPGTLTDQEAYDVSAFVLSHSRPKFDKSKVVSFPPERADFF